MSAQIITALLRRAEQLDREAEELCSDVRASSYDLARAERKRELAEEFRAVSAEAQQP